MDQPELQRLQRALHAARVGVWFADAQGQRLELNDTACDLVAPRPPTSLDGLLALLLAADPAGLTAARTAVQQRRAHTAHGEHGGRQLRLMLGPAPDGPGWEGVLLEGSPTDARTQHLEQLALVAESTRYGVMIGDAQAHLLWINPGFTRLTGFQLADVRGQHPSFLISKQTDGATLARLGRALQRGEPFAAEVRQATRDGQSQWVQLDVQPVRDASGRLTHFVALETDLSQWKSEADAQGAMQAELQRTLAMLRTVLDNTEHSVIATDELGRCTLFNRGAERLLGYAPGEVLGRIVAEVIHEPAELQAFASEVGAPFSDYRVLVTRLVRGAVSDTREWTYRRKDGRRRTVQLTMTPQVVDGQRVGFVGVAIDVTEARAQSARLERLSQHLPGAMFQYRMRRGEAPSMPWASAGVRTVLDLSPDEVRTNGQLLIDAIIDEDRPRVLEGLQASARSSTIFDAEFRVRHRDGRVRWVLCNASPEREEHGAILWHGYVSDITERKAFEAELVRAREAALAASRVKSEFLANMSHEIRTPLNGILGMAQVLVEETGEGPQRKALEAIATSGHTLLAIINDILDLSKVEAGRLELERLSFSPEAVLRRAADTVRHTAEQKGLRLRLELDASLPRRAWGDPTRLLQVLLNLAGNAVKFTERGEVRLAASAREGQLEVSVQDTGIGIAPEVLPRLFSAFTQGDGSITRRYGGTGLGLAISRRLADLMGGTLEARSTPGEGSVFSLRLPLPPSSEETPVPAPSPGTAGRRPLRVLVAEDNAINALVVRSLLEREGHRLVHVTSGRRAVEEAARGDFDLVLMDMQMPELDGLEATRLIRQAEASRGTHLRICALTANAMKGDVDRCRAAGMDDYLAKPLDVRALRRVLAQVPLGGGPESVIHVDG